MRTSCLQVSAMALVVLVMSGCGGVYDSTVSGTVTLDGAAVPRGTIAFHPKSAGPIAYSPIASDGSYTIRTGREAGLKAGEYQVTVTANEASTQLESKSGGPMPPGKSLTPLWYRAIESSGLTFTVEPGSNEINLELTTQPPAGWKPR
jgi:hypothetical protein